LVVDPDVLENISNNFQALYEWKRVLKERGYIVAFVPAFKSLRSGHDVVDRHFRRYNKNELLAHLKKAS
jgi:ubiquinone/menaquinone biosynthesis C-methylase UbiE